MDWNQLAQTAWGHVQPYLLLAGCYIIMLCWKAFWGWVHDRAEAKLKTEESRLARAELMLADAMLRVEEEDAKALRERADGGITPEEGRQLLQKAVDLAQNEVKPLVQGVVQDPQVWMRNKLTALLAKWKARLPFQARPKSPTVPSSPEDSEKPAVVNGVLIDPNTEVGG